MEVLEQPGGGTPTLNVMAICDQRHAKVSKQRTLFADANVAPPHGLAPIKTGKCFSSRNELQQECQFHLRRLQ